MALTHTQKEKIRKIIKRYCDLRRSDGRAVNNLERVQIRTSLQAVTIRENLNLAKLLDFDDFNFVHDVAGLRDHWDGQKLGNFFWPRCGSVNLSK